MMAGSQATTVRAWPRPDRFVLGPIGHRQDPRRRSPRCRLGLDFCTIDLPSVVSKYIGETEPNLSRIFGEAECFHGILFFD